MAMLRAARATLRSPVDDLRPCTRQNTSKAEAALAGHGIPKDGVVCYRRRQPMRATATYATNLLG